MNKQIKHILLLAGLFLALSASAIENRNGLYGNNIQTTTEESTSSKPLFRSEDDWDPDSPGDPNPQENQSPVGEGLLLLAALAGAKYTVKGARKRFKN